MKFDFCNENRTTIMMAISFGAAVHITRVQVTRHRYRGITSVVAFVAAEKAHIASSLAQRAACTLAGRELGWNHGRSSGTSTHMGQKNAAVFSGFSL